MRREKATKSATGKAFHALDEKIGGRSQLPFRAEIFHGD
jgi:hypothetical protein